MSTATMIDNSATVANMYKAFFSGDLDFILAQLDTKCEWVAAGEGSLVQGGTYIGKEVATFFKRLTDYGEYSAFNPSVISNLNDREVVVFGTFTITSRKTGKKANSDWVMHWKFNEAGKVIHFHDFFDTAAVYIAYTP